MKLLYCCFTTSSHSPSDILGVNRTSRITAFVATSFTITNKAFVLDVM